MRHTNEINVANAVNTINVQLYNSEIFATAMAIVAPPKLGATRPKCLPILTPTTHFEIAI